MKYRTKKSGETSTLVFEGELTVEGAKKIKMALRKSLQRSDHLSLDLTQATEIDLFFLQLLCSAHRTAVEMNKRVTLEGPVPKALERFIKDAGYTRHIGCKSVEEKSCLWIRRRSEELLSPQKRETDRQVDM
jgi:ABC-type transporter Mla MlaB component